MKRARLRWAPPSQPLNPLHIAVPRVLGVGIDHAPDGDWGVAGAPAGLPGRSAVQPPLDSGTGCGGARAIGVGLRTTATTNLPVSTCPFDWSVDSRLPVLHPAHRANLPDPPPIDRLVVCHGDACAPNTLIDDVGRYLRPCRLR